MKDSFSLIVESSYWKSIEHVLRICGFMFHKDEHFPIRSVACLSIFLTLCLVLQHEPMQFDTIVCEKKFLVQKIVTKHSNTFLGAIFFHFILGKTYRTRNVRQRPYCSVGAFLPLLLYACVILYKLTCVCDWESERRFGANTTCWCCNGILLFVFPFGLPPCSLHYSGANTVTHTHPYT